MKRVAGLILCLELLFDDFLDGLRFQHPRQRGFRGIIFFAHHMPPKYGNTYYEATTPKATCFGNNIYESIRAKFPARNLLDFLYLILYHDSLLFDDALLVWQRNCQCIVDKIHSHDRSFEQAGADGRFFVVGKNDLDAANFIMP